jgi:hypothetical protein
MYQKSILGKTLVKTFFAIYVAVANFAGEGVFCLEIPNKNSILE